MGRRFGHDVLDILWFYREFFLTSFPQPPILRTQTRGKKREPVDAFLGGRRVHDVDEPGLTNIQRGLTPLRSAHEDSARLSWAFAFFVLRALGFASRPAFGLNPIVYFCLDRRQQ